MATKTKTAKTAYRRVVTEAEKIRNDEPAMLTVLDPGDVVRQGDVYMIRLGAELPAKAADWEGRQVAKGTTQGSRHTAEGPCELFEPEEDSAASVLAKLIPATSDHQQFFGPVIRASEAWTLAHPEHGDRTVPAGDYLIVQQRAFAQTLRRAAD